MKTKKLLPAFLFAMAATLVFFSCSKQNTQESLGDGNTATPAKNTAQIGTGRPIDPPPTGCVFYYYPTECWKEYVLPPSPPFDSYKIVDYYPGDCDGVECSYLGYYNKLRPISDSGDLAVAMFLQARYENGYTKVLHKLSSVLTKFGSIAAINNHLRMSKQLISDE